MQSVFEINTCQMQTFAFQAFPISTTDKLFYFNVHQ